MGAFLGPLGNMIELTQWAETQSVSTGQDPTFFTGLDGSRTAFVQPRVGQSLREWNVSMSKARPRHAAAFQALCLGAHGNGPFAFCDPLAQVTNLLTPRQSLFDVGTFNVSSAGQIRTVVPELGEMPALLGIAALQRIGYGTPALPGRKTTVSVWVSGADLVTVTAQCLTTAGQWTNTEKKTVTDAKAGARVAVSIVPAAGTTQIDMRVTSPSPVTIACPAITWTPGLMPWSPGRGATQVVVHGLQEQLEQASPSNEARQRVSYSATVTEVGSGA